MVFNGAWRGNVTSRTAPEIGVAFSAMVGSRPTSDLAMLHRLINNISIIQTVDDEAALIDCITQAKAPLVVSFVNQHVLNLAAKSSDFASWLIHSDVLLRDGMGMAFCMEALRRARGRNMNGTDFIPRLVAAFVGRRTAIFGTVDPWTTRAAAVLEHLGCDMVSTMDGFKSESDYLAEVVATSPDLIILGMGNPRQEVVAKFIASATTRPLVIVNGGAILDFLAHRFERAPLYMRRARCEWAFRLLLEPRRLWRRYCLGAFSFAWIVLRLRVTL